MQTEASMRQSPEFREHVERMFRPMRPGFARVSTAVYVEEEFEPEAEFDINTFPVSLLPRARADALENIGTFEALLLDTVEKSVVEFMRKPDMFEGMTISWNAANADALEINLSGFSDMNMSIWLEFEFADYCATLQADATLDDPERASIRMYVEEFVGFAAAAMPNFVDRNDDDVYYDSASTEEGMVL